MLNCLVRLYAHNAMEKRVLINACCPGLCNTRIGGGMASKSAYEGASLPFQLATLPVNLTGPNGSYLSDA